MPGLGISPCPYVMFEIRMTPASLYSGSLGGNIAYVQMVGVGVLISRTTVDRSKTSLFVLQSHSHLNSPFEVILKALL